jgi:EAL domain-containing protein (putative c-di-GMP-specific phosphodiesterase class I)
LTEYGLPGSAIEIELTERVILTNIEAAVEQMNNLRALGLSVAIDDFGTGYSSLSYLHRLPIDVLKLDQSFVRAMDRDAKGLQLARSIVSLAHNLALTTIAEGVERQLEHDYLRKIGCDLAQGYLMARPVPAHELDALLQTTIESRARNATPAFSDILVPAMTDAEPACAL